MRLFCVLLLPMACFGSVLTEYVEEPYHTLEVPFKVENGGQTMEEVFLQFYMHHVKMDEDVAIKMRVESSDRLSMAADKCGKRLFETASDIRNASYFFNKAWVMTMMTGISKQCTLHNEFSVNFTIDCTGPCNGTIYFSLFIQKASYFTVEKTHSMEGVIPVETDQNEIPTIVSSDVSNIIDAVYMNSRLRFVLHIEFSTDYTMTIGKCGLDMMRITGNGSMLIHDFRWEEIKLLRMAMATQCPFNTKDTIDYTFTTEIPGRGLITFLMTKTKKSMEHHPESEFGDIELAIGIPKHHPASKHHPVTEIPVQTISGSNVVFMLILVALKAIFQF